MKLLIEGIERESPETLRKASEELLRKGMEEDSKFLVRLSVIAHALSKIFGKEYYRKHRDVWEKFKEKIKGILENANSLADLEKAEEIIRSLDKVYGRYVLKIVEQSKVKKASTLYAWGLSLTRACELVGVSEWYVMEQIGKTKIVDEEEVKADVKKRLEVAEEVL